MKRLMQLIGTHLAHNAHLIRGDRRAVDNKDGGARPDHGAAYRRWRKRRAAGRD